MKKAKLPAYLESWLASDTSKGSTLMRPHGESFYSNEQIVAWANRHDIKRGMRELREMFEDAATAEKQS
jgi:hypothetical protein